MTTSRASSMEQFQFHRGLTRPTMYDTSRRSFLVRTSYYILLLLWENGKLTMSKQYMVWRFGYFVCHKARVDFEHTSLARLTKTITFGMYTESYNETFLLVESSLIQPATLYPPNLEHRKKFFIRIFFLLLKKDSSQSTVV